LRKNGNSEIFNKWSKFYFIYSNFKIFRNYLFFPVFMYYLFFEIFRNYLIFWRLSKQTDPKFCHFHKLNLQFFKLIKSQFQKNLVFNFQIIWRFFLIFGDTLGFAVLQLWLHGTKHSLIFSQIGAPLSSTPSVVPASGHVQVYPKGNSADFAWFSHTPFSAHVSKPALHSSRSSHAGWVWVLKWRIPDTLKYWKNFYILKIFLYFENFFYILKFFLYFENFFIFWKFFYILKFFLYFENFFIFWKFFIFWNIFEIF